MGAGGAGVFARIVSCVLAGKHIFRQFGNPNKVYDRAWVEGKQRSRMKTKKKKKKKKTKEAGGGSTVAS